MKDEHAETMTLTPEEFCLFDALNLIYPGLNVVAAAMLSKKMLEQQEADAVQQQQEPKIPEGLMQAGFIGIRSAIVQTIMAAAVFQKAEMMKK